MSAVRMLFCGSAAVAHSKMNCCIIISLHANKERVYAPTERSKHGNVKLFALSTARVFGCQLQPRRCEASKSLRNLMPSTVNQNLMPSATKLASVLDLILW
ncbi:hypothetical protein AB6A40_001907 [Gnathostoma spinigerum]|uniref:Secreted protein n=1 Tax=Gnathostoma spinigerum TaxID=75299 RepID=A0ABD6E5F5_9BILA